VFVRLCVCVCKMQVCFTSASAGAATGASAGGVIYNEKRGGGRLVTCQQNNRKHIYVFKLIEKKCGWQKVHLIKKVLEDTLTILYRQFKISDSFYAAAIFLFSDFSYTLAAVHEMCPERNDPLHNSQTVRWPGGVQQ